MSGCAPSLPVYSRHRHRDGAEEGIVVSAEENGNGGVAAANVPEGRVIGHDGAPVSHLSEMASGQGVGEAIGYGV